MLDIQEQVSVSSSTIFSQLESHEHEQVAFCHDPSLGLKAIIAIHDTSLGPAIGGTRLWPYKQEQEAISDVLRLSRGMTYKSALAGLNIGGGKAVIIGHPSQKNEFFLRRYGNFVHSLGGRYWTAEDVNMSTSDMEYIRMETPHVLGMPLEMGGSGDPSPMTAYGVLIGIKAAAKHTYGSDSLQGKRIVVQGAGHVGSSLVGQLLAEGAKVSVSDINDDKLRAIIAKHPSVEIISPDEIPNADADIFSPCALGGILNPETIPQFKYNIIAGAANNQLEDEIRDGQQIYERGILYIPDFMINAGGIINVYYEYHRMYEKKLAMHHIEKSYETITNVVRRAEEEQITTHQAALNLAQQRLSESRRFNAKLPTQPQTSH